jgi:hypothetical protein
VTPDDILGGSGTVDLSADPDEILGDSGTLTADELLAR